MPRSAPARTLRLALLGALLLPVLVLSSGRLPTPDAAAAGAVVRTLAPAAVAAAVPPSVAPAQPSLALSWSGSTAQVGVPARLSLQALTTDGQPDGGRGGTALLLIDDGAARVTLADANQTPVAASPVSIGRAAVRAAVPLAGGAAQVLVSFAAPGPRAASATMQDDPTVGGEAPRLPVADTFFTLTGSATAGRGARSRVTVAAVDAQGHPRRAGATPAASW